MIYSYNNGKWAFFSKTVHFLKIHAKIFTNKMFINKQEGRVKRSTDESGLTMTCQLFDMSDGKKMMSDGHIMLLYFF